MLWSLIYHTICTLFWDGVAQPMNRAFSPERSLAHCFVLSKMLLTLSFVFKAIFSL